MVARSAFFATGTVLLEHGQPKAPRITAPISPIITPNVKIITVLNI
jgi:hypothetical protein